MSWQMILFQDLHVVGDPCISFLIILPKMYMCVYDHSNQNSIAMVTGYRLPATQKSFPSISISHRFLPMATLVEISTSTFPIPLPSGLLHPLQISFQN